MSLLTLSQLRAIQKLGEEGMNITVEVLRRNAQAKDPTNDFGDNDVTYAAPFSVKGWLVTKPTERLDLGEGQVQVIATHQLRVPVGTGIRPGDHVTVGDETFIAVDSTSEQSWPEWELVYLRGYQG